jgi:hypothetical protein
MAAHQTHASTLAHDSQSTAIEQSAWIAGQVDGEVIKSSQRMELFTTLAVETHCIVEAQKPQSSRAAQTSQLCAKLAYDVGATACDRLQGSGVDESEDTASAATCATDSATQSTLANLKIAPMERLPMAQITRVLNLVLSAHKSYTSLNLRARLRR